MMKLLPIAILALAFAPHSGGVELRPVEIHDQLALQAEPGKKIALTLDACSGKFDSNMIDFLIKNRIPATIFATKKWLNRNPLGLSVIKAHLDLFDVENHGEKHIPAVIGAGKSVYGIPGEPDVVHLRREVIEGGKAVEKATGIAPHWYRSATAEYDAQAISEIDKLGYKIAGFSVNADDGATSKQRTIEKRLARVKAGDVIIAHMNKPASDSAKGLSVGLAYLLKAGFTFVRLDQVKLQESPAKAGRNLHRKS
ncbi:polysaccharide deacetylase family protein [Sideroxydans lithotrophicus]|uniref:Polysaccharide deacetylase n=1 Tax=Sideroxydans lithotrophicus (strain ES-1) TaxID=580332 RepID=D5CTL0_SIDLE|nr:polysaccharide deacetylase family protein [Sideroxydans lithotrophicus]ADE10316.1 polysaccharide deacetylase [Sideroxydans lithotrophicus ES-1]